MDYTSTNGGYLFFRVFLRNPFALVSAAAHVLEPLGSGSLESS